MGSLPRPHFVIFPFMSQGHIIPLLHLSRLLCRRSSSTAVTVVSTSGNSAAIRSALAGSGVSILELPFPENVDGVPPGVENTQHLPSMQSLLPFLQSTKLMQPIFEKFLGTLTPSVSCIVSDGFLGWTLDSARKFCIPRYAFFGMGSFSSTMYQVLGRERPHAGTVSLDEPFPMPGFPGLMLTRNDFDPLFGEIDPCGPYVDFMMEQLAAIAASRGIIVNSFYELEGEYIEYWDRRIGPKAHCVGPLCMAVVDGPCFTDEEGKRLAYVEFLDRKLSGGEPVLYVAFGTQAEVSEEQIREIAKGLEDSMVSFLWVLGWREAEFLGGLGFEGRVNGRGLVVKGWVDQFGILRHGGVGGFMSHCGWNSVMEGISAGVPVVALPVMAEQHMNARFVVEVAGVGLRAAPEGGATVRGLVAAEEVERRVRELMGGGGKGAEVRRRAAECGRAARESMGEKGSSTRALDLLVEEVCGGTASF